MLHYGMLARMQAIVRRVLLHARSANRDEAEQFEARPPPPA